LKLEYNPSITSDFESFYIERKKAPYYGMHWHYHEEFELMYSMKGEGVRIVGDNMDHFNENELVFLGSNVPHLFKHEEKGNPLPVDFIVIKFNALFDGQYPLFQLPEFSKINQFLTNSNRGILFSKQTIEKVKEYLIKITESSDADRFIYLFTILNILASETDFEQLSEEPFSLRKSAKGEDRTQKVIDYISVNYTKNITLEDLAEVAYMTTNSFCRFFKDRTGKTAFQFLREFRINKACQMLINGEKSIAEICYDTGFNSFSSFNRIFKKLKNISASEYKARYIQLNKA